MGFLFPNKYFYFLAVIFDLRNNKNELLNLNTFFSSTFTLCLTGKHLSCLFNC